MTTYAAPRTLAEAMAALAATPGAAPVAGGTDLVVGVRGGKAYDSTWGKRQTGEGPYAWMTGRRFELAAARLGLNQQRVKLRADLFVSPRGPSAQLSLF